MKPAIPALIAGALLSLAACGAEGGGEEEDGEAVAGAEGEGEEGEDGED